MTIFAVMTAGCSSAPKTVYVAMPDLPQAMPVNPPVGSLMLASNTYAGDALQKMLLSRMSSGHGILTTSFVNIDDFEKTSSFGRVASQQVASRLGQYGFRIIEARLSDTLRMHSGSDATTGEFMLTRNASRLLSETYDAGAVLVGSYSDRGSSIYVSARVVRLSDNTVMGAYEYYVPRDSDAGFLLADGGRRGIVGDGIWQHYSGREQAFDCTENPSAAKGVARGVPRSVPRHVTPAAKPRPRNTVAATPSPVVVPQVVVPPPPPTVLPGKDYPSPETIPGGRL